MKYLTVDGMLSGTGIRESIEERYLTPEKLGLSSELINKISDWLSGYENAHYEQYANRNKVAELDAEGLEICAMLRREIPDSKIEYYSNAYMKKTSV